MGDVHVGDFGWLYLRGGSNAVFSQFTEPGSFTPWHAESWIQLLAQRGESARSLGVGYFHLMAPEKLAVYSEFVGADVSLSLTAAPSWRLPEAMLDHPLSAILEQCYVDVRGPLRGARRAKPMFWKTDSHWTPDGAFVAYQVLCSRLGIAPRYELLVRPVQRGSLVLDLGGRLPNPVSEDFWVRDHVLEATRIFANAVVQYKESKRRENDPGLHLGSRVTFENATNMAADLSVMLFGDSFSEYRSTLLTGLLAETVRRLDFIWSPRVDWGLVESSKPDVVISELAERFHVRVPVDTGYDLKTHESEVVRKAVMVSLEERALKPTIGAAV